MNKLLPLILILFAAPCFGESYLCVADQSVGFDSSNNWSPVNFKPESKYVVKSTEGDVIAESDEKWVLQNMEQEQSLPTVNMNLKINYLLKHIKTSP